MPKKWTLAELPFLVGLPIPCLDNKGRPVGQIVMQEWINRATAELTKCFGGATPSKSPAQNIVGRRVLYEKDQVLVLSGCASRKVFLAHRKRIESFAKRMGAAMNQYAVFVLAFSSESFLVIDEQAAR